MYFSLLVLFYLESGADSDDLPHYVKFHLGLHCLPKYLLGISSIRTVDGTYVNRNVDFLM